MPTTPYESLEKIFHEPSRLAIVSELTGTRKGIAFGELKERCSLTDGNLSRHLSALEKEKVIRIEKSFVGAKPRTTVFLTDSGRESFLDYLDALEKVLHAAAARVKESKRVKNPIPGRLLKSAKS